MRAAPACGAECTGCTFGSGSGAEALRMARVCGQGVFVAYVREWFEWPLPGRDRGLRLEVWDFLRYMVAPGRDVAWRRVRDVFPGADRDDVLVVLEDDAAALMRGQAEYVRERMVAAASCCEWAVPA